MVAEMKVVSVVRKLVIYLVKKVLVYDLLFLVLAAFTFIFTGHFSASAFSERLFWIGVVVFLIAGTMGFAHMIPPRMMMFPYNVRKPEDAKKFVDDAPAARESDEKRLDAGFHVWFIALGCLALAAMIQTFFGQ